MTVLLHRLFGGRRWIAVVVIVVILAAGLWWAIARPGTASADSPTTSTTTATASLETMEKAVSATGTVTPAVQEQVSFAAAGTVLSVKVAEGDTVTKGQVLATIDTTQLEVNRAQAAVDLANAEEKLSSARSAYTGSDATQAALDLAKAQVTQATAAKQAAEDAMSDATLKAPVAGLVTAVNLDVGDAVSASSASAGSPSGAGSTGGGETSGGGSTGTSSSGQFTIIGTDAWTVEATVSESDIAHITTGDQVTMTTEDASDKIFGTVQSVSTVASTTSGSAAFPVVIAVTGSPEGLHDGVSVSASVIYERRTDVLTVPSAAVTTVNGTSTVTKVTDGKDTNQRVTVGETSGSLTEITAGLSEGDQVRVTTVTGGQSTAGTGSRGVPGQLPGGESGGQMPGGGQIPQMPDGQMPQMPGQGNANG